MKLKLPKLENLRTELIKANFVPKKYSEYLTDMNYICNKYSEDIYRKREKEVDDLFNILMKTKNANAMLLGPNGVGKSAIVLTAIHKVLQGKCPDELKDFHFIAWDIERTLADITELAANRQKIQDVFELISTHSDIIVIIDQVHLAAGSNVLANYLSVLLRSTNVKVIGITTGELFCTCFIDENKIVSSVDIINVNIPSSDEIYPMISEYVKVLEKKHKIKVSEEMIKYTVAVANAFNSTLFNPGLTTNFLERSMIIAKRAGRKSVTKKDINANFNFNYKLFSKISYDDKKITAYHEAGHFIVAKMSKNIKNYRTTAISIIPAEKFLGVTLFEFNQEKQTSCDSDYYIDNIAVDLAGRVAETILNGSGDSAKYTNGAFSDLKSATQTARDIVTEFGMIKDCGYNMTYFANYDLVDLALLSEKDKATINLETQKLIEEAYHRAEKILNENLELLDAIAKELLKNEILDEKDLDRICEKVLNKK